MCILAEPCSSLKEADRNAGSRSRSLFDSSSLCLRALTQRALLGTLLRQVVQSSASETISNQVLLRFFVHTVHFLARVLASAKHRLRLHTTMPNCPTRRTANFANAAFRLSIPASRCLNTLPRLPPLPLLLPLYLRLRHFESHRFMT